MLDSQREILKNQNSEYLSLGITQNGEPYGAIAVPWEHTASAFNMKTPNVYLSEQDLKDPEIREILKEYHIIGCYIFNALQDYSFIADFKELHDVFILDGCNITDLSFMKELNEWFMLYIEDARLPNLDPLFPKGKKDKFFPYCIGFGGCEIKDITALENSEIYLSELIVLCPKGTNDREKWQNIRCGTYSYYEYDLK